MSKIYIKPSGQPEAEWKEVSSAIIQDSITITEEGSEAFRPTCMQFSATLNIRRKIYMRFLQSIGVLKTPRCTYKTIKRDCAKRNKYK